MRMSSASWFTISNSLSHFQTADLVPAARFLRPGFAFSLHAPPEGVGGAPRVVRVLARHPWGLHVTRQARRLGEAPCVPRRTLLPQIVVKEKISSDLIL